MKSIHDHTRNAYSKQEKAEQGFAQDRGRKPDLASWKRRIAVAACDGEAFGLGFPPVLRRRPWPS
jgi:hypothetical protein